MVSVRRDRDISGGIHRIRWVADCKEKPGFKGQVIPRYRCAGVVLDRLGGHAYRDRFRGRALHEETRCGYIYCRRYADTADRLHVGGRYFELKGMGKG